MSASIRVRDHLIGPGREAYIVAEAGSNHDGDLSKARKLIDVASRAGADAVKFQLFTARELAARTDHEVARLDDFGADTLYELYEKSEMPREWISDLARHADDRDVAFLATPFDEEAVDLLDDLGVPVFKVASFELNHVPLLQHIATKGRPIFLSTGMARLGEIETALAAVGEVSDPPVALMQCTSVYPTPYEEANLAAIDTMRQAFDVPVGLSDHTEGWEVPVAAVARGADVIEKHFTLSRQLEGPDHSFSLEPAELERMVTGIRRAEAALGSPVKLPTESEIESRRRGRRSLFAARTVEEGETIARGDLAVLRPGVGLEPTELDAVVGRTARRRIEKHEPITWDRLG